MFVRKTEVINKSGLHARPAAQFVTSASKFASEITVKNLNTNREVNAKSIVLLLTLAICKGTPVQIAAEGPDEEAAANTLADLIEGGFGDM